MRRPALLALVLFAVCTVCALLGSRPAAATTVYMCRAADGHAIYQDKPCPRSQPQQAIDLPDVPSMSAPAAMPAPAAPTSSGQSAAPTPTAPAAALPTMYGCVRATDGKAYLSSRGDPAPYLAPYGMLSSDPPQSLSQVYGPTHGNAGISAPEANRGRVTAGLIASNYVWVQDQCRALSAEETCQALQQAYDDNEHKLHNAFKSQRPPLEKREAELHAQLGSCSG